MEIRSVTLFVEPDFIAANAEGFFKNARSSFHVPVQTTRVATTPFPNWWNPNHYSSVKVKEFVEPWQKAGVDFLSLGPLMLDHDDSWIDKILDLLAKSDVIFLTSEIADTKGMVDIGRCKAIAKLVQELSTLKPDGFANLQFAALANTTPGSPFFPVAYHGGGLPHFALAVEAGDLPLKLLAEFSKDTSKISLQEFQNMLINEIEREAAQLTLKALELAEHSEFLFSGLDFTLAPFPLPERSLAGGLEGIGLTRLGAPGSTFAAAILADAIRKAKYQKCGFSGLLFPVLEDTLLATRVGEGAVSLSDLLNYASVCGAGLDVIPLPGSITLETLTGILLDVAGLAIRLDKPLTARLMPIPGLNAGDAIDIDFPWFAKGRVMGTTVGGVNNLLSQPGRVRLNAYHQKDIGN